jgi:ABC-type nitrate/sulfonate/bicarbonate transport system substrate-binding protein
MRSPRLIRHRCAAAAAVVVGIAGILSACSSSSDGKKSGGVTTLKVGGVGSTLYLPFYVAIEQGYFKDQGVAMNITTIANSQPLVTGSVNLQLTALDTSIIDAAAGRATPVIAIMQQRNGLSLYVRADKATPAMTSASYPANVAALKSLGKATVAVTNLASGAAPLRSRRCRPGRTSWRR